MEVEIAGHVECIVDKRSVEGISRKLWRKMLSMKTKTYGKIILKLILG
jgi:hypothetical protein